MTEMTTVGEDMKVAPPSDENNNQEVISLPYNSILAWDKRESTEEECTCHNAS
jgi:hypothetical protein